LALNIKSDEADRLARELADRTGETLTQVVVTALRERLERSRPSPDDDEDLINDVLQLAERFSQLPVLDARSADEILGYGKHGVPGSDEAPSTWCSTHPR